MNNKKFTILKSFLATASILGLSLTTPTNAIYAAAVSQMLGDVNLNVPNTNFSPPFVNGNTIEVVGHGNISTPGSGRYVVGAILANQYVSNINVSSTNRGRKSVKFIIGSIAGSAFVNKITGKSVSSYLKANAAKEAKESGSNKPKGL